MTQQQSEARAEAREETVDLKTIRQAHVYRLAQARALARARIAAGPNASRPNYSHGRGFRGRARGGLTPAIALGAHQHRRDACRSAVPTSLTSR
jgi:hypothetical protein